MIRKAFRNLVITCDKHLDRIADYYCHQHRTLQCKLCILTAHRDHSHDCRYFHKENLVDFIAATIRVSRMSQERLCSFLDMIRGARGSEGGSASEMRASKFFDVAFGGINLLLSAKI